MIMIAVIPIRIIERATINAGNGLITVKKTVFDAPMFPAKSVA